VRPKLSVVIRDMKCPRKAKPRSTMILFKILLYEHHTIEMFTNKTLEK